MKKYHVIMHTHWDREWYFTKEETMVLLKNHMLNLFDFLEKHPEHTYVLDGQTVMISDFLELAPEYEFELRKYIENGQIKVGPWYTQTDLMLVRGESIVRNLYYGLKLAKEYTNNPLLVGYSPDTFGHNIQMPQIYKRFGIDSSFFWRGVSKEISSHANFNWQALDGSKIIGHSLSAGYQGAKYLIPDVEDLKERIQTIEKKYNDYSTFDNILLMNGHDQMPVQLDIDEVVKTFHSYNKEDEIKISTFAEYLEDVKGEIGEDVVVGELYDAEFTRVHKTISSTRMDIKLLNTKVEDLIYNVLEPLSVIAMEMKLPYPHTLIEKTLKILFGVHAHDSIGGCNTDEVNEAIMQRLIDARELVETQIDLTKRLISKKYDEKGEGLTMFNLLPYERTNLLVRAKLQTTSPNFELYDKDGEKLEYQITNQYLRDMAEIDRQILARRLEVKRYETDILIKLPKIKGLSTIAVKVVETEEKKSELSENVTLEIENEFYKISLVDGFNLLLKESNTLVKNFINLENSGDGGDGYDFSPFHNDWIIEDNEIELSSVEKIIRGPYSESIDFNISIELPKNEESRIKGLRNEKQEFRIKIELQKNSKDINISLVCLNNIEDQRMRISFKSLTEASVVKADVQYGNIKREALNTKLDIWEEKNWVEKPVSIEHFESYVSVGDSFTVYAKGLKEYELINDKVYITLYRGIGYMGRSDLVNRPGRASGMAVPTPLNQLVGVTMEFNFMVNYFEESNPDKKAKEWLSPTESYQIQEINRFNVNTSSTTVLKRSELNEDFKDLVITAVKCVDGRNDILIRGYNPFNETINIDLSNKWLTSNFNEDRLEKISELIVKPFEIFTIIKGEK